MSKALKFEEFYIIFMYIYWNSHNFITNFSFDMTSLFPIEKHVCSFYPFLSSMIPILICLLQTGPAIRLPNFLDIYLHKLQWNTVSLNMN